MSISAYLAGAAMEVSKNVWVILITVIGEWLCFLTLAGCSLPGSGSYLYAPALLAADLLLQYQFFPISLHCVLQITLWTGYICLQGRQSWYSALFESAFFCLLLEVGKASFRGPSLAYILSVRLPGLAPEVISVITFVIYLLYLTVLTCVFRHSHFRMENLRFTPLQTAGFLFPLFLYLFVRQYQSGLGEGTEAETYIILEVIALAVGICAVIVMETIIRMLLSENRRMELLRRQMLQEQQHSQYLIQKEALDAVNRRYHDLKHYLSIVEGTGGDHDRELRDFASRLRGEIGDYETIRETGSQALDVLLAQRVRECREKEIRLIPYVDGRGLGFMHVMDLCTIFGNAMDNAIEETVKIAEPGRREIRVKIERYGELIIFRFSNTCHVPPAVPAQGRTVLPTTKADSTFHGYGLPNIREAAERYGGSMSMRVRGQIFELVVMIPRQEDEGAADEPFRS